MTSRLQLLGAPALICEETPVDFPRRKALALLSYLAVTRARHQRESLATMLWPESQSTAAHSALRNLLWSLRATPIAELLQSNRSFVELSENESLSVDVNLFRTLIGSCPSNTHGGDRACALCEPQLAEAISLWSGPFMDGYVVANSTQFEDWQFAEGEALKREFIETLHRLVDHYTSVEDWAASERYARQWLRIDAWNEIACRGLMRALAALGRRSEALQAHDRLEQDLVDELGLTPEAETTTLAASIRETGCVPAETPVNRRRLPHPGGRVVGRREIADRIEALLLDSATRAVNLVGLGGDGKTTLALHVGRRVEGHFANGAVFIPVDTMRDDSSDRDNLIATAVVAALGLSRDTSEGSSLLDHLANTIRDQRLLILLDGVENVLPSALAFVRALQSAPHVRLLLTSRAEISDPSVVSVLVRGLDVPADDALPEALETSPAVRVLQLAAERHGVAPSSDRRELLEMTRLARLVDGSPLGLEMAAGWRPALPWSAIASHVSEGLAFLVHRDEVVAMRHRTMAAVFEQSWDLLQPAAAATLGRLSVFRGPFTAQAAERVAGCSPASLASLVNRCFLIRDASDLFRMHELVRQFSEAKLRESMEEEATRTGHMEHYAEATTHWFEELKGPNQHSALLQMEREFENVRVAFQQAAADGATDLLRAMCECIAVYCIMRTLLTEAEFLFFNASTAYREHDNRDEEVDAFLTIMAGYYASWDRPHVATERCIEGLELLPDAPPSTRLHAFASQIYSYACFGRERDENRRRLEECLQFYRERGDRWGEAFALACRGALERYTDEAKSEDFALRSLRIRRDIGDVWGEGLMQFRLAQIAESKSEFKLALERYHEAQRLYEPISKDPFGRISVLIAEARVLLNLGHAERSLEVADEATRKSWESGYKFQIGRSLVELARASRALGDLSSAKEHLKTAFSELANVRWHDLQAGCARLLVEIAVDEADLGAAQRWLHEAQTLEPNHEENEALAARVKELGLTAEA